MPSRREVMRKARRAAAGVTLAGLAAAAGAAAAPRSAPAVPVPAVTFPGPPPPAAATPAGAFDPAAATEAYLARLSPRQRARSDAYFEGTYWLLLWDFLYGAGISVLLLAGGVSVRLRDLAERWFSARPLQTIFYAALYLLAAALLGAPLTIYEGFVRERRYGLATQSFVAWLGEQLEALGVNVVLGSLAIALLYGVLRRAPRTWWAWGAMVAIVLLAVGSMLGPVFIEPIFNRYTELRDPTVRDRVLSLARANGVPAEHVYMVDASRQTTKVSANVAGLLGTTRIALNDNLLRRCTLPEIEAVMGHEMGHYVLHHMWKALLFFGVLAAAGFAFLQASCGRALARWGAGWGIRDLGDPAGLPLLALLLSIFMFLMTPVVNTYVRTEEAEADLFGLNAARQPDGEAEVSLKLAEYRKLAPGPVEEWIFFDHPSGRNRILMAMRWKAEHRNEPPVCRP